jgi:hypothetical protein
LVVSSAFLHIFAAEKSPNSGGALTSASRYSSSLWVDANFAYHFVGGYS